MSKKEIVWRFILSQACEKGVVEFTQQEIAAKFGFSTSTVFNAVKAPRAIAAIAVTGRSFKLLDKEKLLLLWATARSLKKETIYSTYVDASASDIEGRMIPGALFTAYSGYKFLYNEAPADYDVVYVYCDDSAAIQKRFPPSGKKYHNLFVLKSDPWLKTDNGVAAPVQLFVDLWNLPQWYAKDFLNELKNKLQLNP